MLRVLGNDLARSWLEEYKNILPKSPTPSTANATPAGDLGPWQSPRAPAPRQETAPSVCARATVGLAAPTGVKPIAATAAAAARSATAAASAGADDADMRALLEFFSVSTPPATDELSGAPGIELGTAAPAAPSEKGEWLKRLYEMPPPAIVLPVPLPLGQAEDAGAYSAERDGTEDFAYFPGEAALLLRFKSMLEAAVAAADIDSEAAAAATSSREPAADTYSAANVATEAAEALAGQVDAPVELSSEHGAYAAGHQEPPPGADSQGSRQLWDPGGDDRASNFARSCSNFLCSSSTSLR
jgi:hypothetical protein